MSGIYIPGMGMPKYGCLTCFLRTERYCGIIEKDESVVEYARKNERHPDCPLITVPDHGRLIDADALLTSKGVGTQIAGWGKMYHETCIEYAPTIIPASGKEEEK